MLSWYALQIRTGFEPRVRDRLSSADIEAYFPSYRVISKDRCRAFERNLFPGYVFGRFDWQDEKRHVVPLPELIRIVGLGSEPLAIPEQEIEQVKLIMSKPGATPCDYLPVAGDEVEVKDGAMQGLRGYVCTMRQRKDRVTLVVSIHMLQRSISTEIEADRVTLITRAAA